MIVIGIVGGIAAGKTMVADMFCEHPDTYKISTDDLLHGLILQQDIQAQLFKRWEDIPEVRSLKISGNNFLCRERISKIVFDKNNIEELKFVEDITCVPLKAMILDKLFYYDNPRTKMVVLDAPLLFEAGLEDICDKIVFVSAPAETRIARHSARKLPLCAEDLLYRESIQRFTLEEKQAGCNETILNEGNLQSTRILVEKFWKEFV